MKLNINDWMDRWFLSLLENPDKLDERIRVYEHTRIVASICMVIVLALLLLVTISGKGVNDNTYLFFYIMFVFMLVLNLHADTHTKILKLLRQQQNRDTEDTRPPSGTAKKSAISVMAWVYGPMLGVLILGFLMYVYYVRGT